MRRAQTLYAAFLASLLAACGSDPKPTPPPPTVDPYRSTLATAPASALADGSAHVTLTAIARDGGGAAIPGRVATFTVTGSDNALSAATATTDATGSASVTLASIRAEPKTASVVIDGVAVRERATAVFEPGPAASLSLSNVPAATTAGVALAVTVTALDAHGNVAAGYLGTLRATSSDAAAVLPADLAFSAADAGRRTFPIAWRTAGTMTVVLTDVVVGSLTVTASSSVAPAAAQRLAFTAQPAGAVAGVAFSPPVRVSILDPYGNLVTSGTPAISLQLQGGAPGALLSGGGANPASGGTAEFVALSVDKAGTAYRLAATSAGLLDAASAPFTIAPGTPDASASSVTALPSSLTAGGTSTLSAIVRDLFGNPIPGVAVTFAATGTASTLQQPAAATDGAGMAVGALSSNAAGGRTVTALAGTTPLAPQPVVTFTAGPADAGRSTAALSPASLVADGTASATFTVTVLDAWGNPLSGQSVAVSSSRGTADVISAPWVATSGSGVATFTVRSGIAGASTLTAVVSSLPAPLLLTAPVTFVPGPVSAAGSTVTAAPASVAADGVSPATVTVTLRDASGNAVPGKAVSLASDRATDDAIAPASVTSDAAGVATFTVTSSKFGKATFTATDTTDALPLVQTAQVSFTGTVSAARSTVGASASSILADGSATSVVTVKVLDAFGNPVAGQAVTLASARGTTDTITPASATTDAVGQVGFTVSSRTFGLSTFTATITAHDVKITQTAAVTFLSYLVFSAPPSDVTAGAPFSPAVTVAARDASGNTDAAFASAVTLALGAAPAGATLRGTLTVTPAAGVASFGDVFLDKAGVNYTLVASTTAGGIPSVTSTPFAVSAGAAAALAFKVQPSNSGAGIGAPILVGLLDAYGNVSSATGVEIAVAFGTNPTGALLGGTLTRKSLQGIATFQGLTVSLPGTGYTLVASAPLGALTPATSTPFDVKPASYVGSGTPASCTEAALDAALAAGGHYHFDCGPSPVTITLTSTKSIARDVGLDGVGRVTLSGANALQLFSVPAARTVALENLTLSAGATGGTGGAIYNAGTLSISNCGLLDSTAGGSWAWGGASANGGAIHNDGGALVVSGTTFSGNHTGGSWNSNGTFYDGGAIFSTGGTVAIDGSTFTNNTTSGSYPYGGTSCNGGAIFQSGGTLRVTASTFSSNTAGCAYPYSGTMNVGGAIYAAGESLLVADSTFSANVAAAQNPSSGTFGAGGAIFVGGGTATVLRSTFTANGAYANYAYSCTAGDGGAIFVAAGALVAANSTFAGNTGGGTSPYGATTGNGGAVFNQGGRVSLVNATLADNTAGASWCYSSTCGLGTAIHGGAKLTNTIVKGSGNCSGTFVDGGRNLDSDGTCGVGPATDPLLATAGLASNGGPTQTIALQVGSPAIGAGDPTVCAASPVSGVDQRGYGRPGVGQTACSIGAFENGGAP